MRSQFERGDEGREFEARPGVDSNDVMARLAHDLNNLLTPIVAISAGLELDLEGQRVWRDQIRDLRLAAERATLLVQRTLSSLRLRSESAVRVSDVVSELQRLLQVVAGSSVTVEVEAKGRCGVALLDRNGLESALLDLVSNARDAISGIGTIVISTRSLTLDAHQAEAIGAPPAASYELIEVSDTGSGIPSDLYQRIFERHFTTKPSGRGNGLGLANVHRFVNESRGAIQVRSRTGAGSTFSLYFPSLSGSGRR